jgi:N-acetylglucosaminyl-diphospho-decaprenol L-rhamnosyltransferase
MQREEPSLSVSVVIPHFGDPSLALDLVAQLRSQVGGPPSAIVVVDDQSPVAFPETDGVKIVRRPANGGFGAAVNSGASVVDADLMLVMNSDLQIEPTFLTDLLAGATPWMPAVVAPTIVNVDGSAAWTGRHFPRTRHQVVEWLTPLARFRDFRPVHRWVGHDTAVGDASATAVDWVVGAALLLPTADFHAVGGFDERFFMNSEEVDLQRRLRARGLPCVLLASPVALHEGGGSSDAARRRSWLVTSRLAYAEKWGGRRRLQVALTAATAVNLGWNIGRRCIGRPVSPWQAAHAELELIWPKVP